jgi:hypothetical protein
LKFALGAVQFGTEYGIANRTGRVSPHDVRRILKEAAQRGVDMLDTAIAYGDSEATLGQIGVAGWRVVTKLPTAPALEDELPAWVERQVRGSLERLQTERVYAILLHRPQQLLEPKGLALWAALERMRTVGLTEKIGVSIYAPEEIEPLLDKVRLDIVQAPLNILDRRLVAEGWARKLKSTGIEVHVRSIFLQGLLLMQPKHRPAKFARWRLIWDEWDRWLEMTSLTPIAACVAYAASCEDVDRVVVGVDSLVQLQEILAVANTHLPSVPSWPVTIDDELINPAHWNKI